MSPTAQKLNDQIHAILAETKGTGTFVSERIQGQLGLMRPSDLDALDPPPISNGYWTDDNAFCRRLAGRLFEVSPETIDEMNPALYPVMLSIVSQNFLAFLARAIRD